MHDTDQAMRQRLAPAWDVMLNLREAAAERIERSRRFLAASDPRPRKKELPVTDAGPQT